ncbi:MAG TPA: DUF6067 family protein [Candidatus Hydrogenedentes bacterium]|nr:DUF6067 family protein [Candidatus Hydrogenedentota bacterium]HOS01718.1 DUF6067 family protein [Candidatus Hydrogenedentota bacterium]
MKAIVPFCILSILVCGAAAAHDALVPNGTFQEGGPDTVAGWTLSGGQGSVDEQGVRDGARALVVHGEGEDSNYWRSAPLPLEPMTLYALRFSARRLEQGTGPAITGPAYCNVDYVDIRSPWKSRTNRFLTPATLNDDKARIRFGQWRASGSLAFSDVRLDRILPLYADVNGLALGDGERIEGNQYYCNLPLRQTMSNHSRSVFLLDCSFNTLRYVFGKGDQLVLRHHLGGRRLLSATLSLALTYHVRGELEVDVSADGEHWQPLGKFASRQTDPMTIPDALLPAETVWVRLRDETGEPLVHDSDIGSFGVEGYFFQARVDGPPVHAAGSTSYMQITHADPNLEVLPKSMRLRPGEAGTLTFIVNNKTGKPLTSTASIVEFTQDKREKRAAKQRIRLEPGAHPLTLSHRLQTVGSKRLDIKLGPVFQSSCEIQISEIFNASYGERLSRTDASVGLWWAESGWKISPTRVMPNRAGRAMRITLAQNETEAAQLVIKPQSALTGVRVACGPLIGPDKKRLPDGSVEALRVGYVNIVFPTDYTSAPGPWPDPLLPLDKPFDIAAGENQPLWIRVKTPPDAAPGEYASDITLTADGGYAVRVPLRVRVHGFALPDRMTCATAFGFNANGPFRYQKCETPEQKRLVLDKYLRCLADHHLSPYDPAPLDPFVVKWPDIPEGAAPDPSALSVDIDWSDWDKAMEKAFHEYRFSFYRIPAQGMAKKRSDGRLEQPSLLGFGEESPVYQTLFDQYWRNVQEHLREKGWLSYGYVYWFDEPESSHYPLVKKGFERLNQAAPDLIGMLTEQPEPELFGGPKLWCPISHAYEQEVADRRREAGDRFWWYVCTGPKAPYATIFIDHPGSELRVWLWQTWQRNIEGVLVWQTTQWTSPLIYPDPKRPQNPYEDPMTWVSSGAAPGQLAYHGNGDGRLIYPPLAAVDGSTTGPVLEGPVESFRLEMLRDGIEDYEYLVILKRLLEQKRAALSPKQARAYEKLLHVPAAITTSATEFTISPAPIEERRNAIAHAIEALSRETP